MSRSYGEILFYILSSHSRTLYVGMTNGLERCAREHKAKLIPDFTADYNISRLVHFESSGNVRDAIACEKQIKGWVRRRKIALIEERNPHWDDLGENLQV